MEEKYQGTVVWFTNLYGFIEWKLNEIQQPDLFIHFSDITCEGFKTLKAGQTVSFSLGLNHKGKPKAVDVKVL